MVLPNVSRVLRHVQAGFGLASKTEDVDEFIYQAMIMLAFTSTYQP